MTATRTVAIAAIGVAAGLLSGLFGIGGGIILVPAFIAIAKLDPKTAAGTSLLAIVPLAVSGVASYALIGGSVDVVLAAGLAAGSVLGAPLGAKILSIISREQARWAFLVFLVAVAISLVLTVPSRDGVFVPSVGALGAITGLGFVVGIVSGVLGIGGGVIVVPALVLAFGISDLVAKGSSLLMIIATGLSGTIANARLRQFDASTALIAGTAAALTAPIGALGAAWLSPVAANIAFAGLLMVIGATTLRGLLRERRKQRAGGKESN